MAWIPSHQELRNHPKLKRAARIANVPAPTMIGHLHLLWWWALDHAPDGDLSRYDEWDIADAAMWEGDAEVFLMALKDCGPKGSAGFVADERLHDWDEYGGKYSQRVEAARKAAAARWHPEPDADALRPHSVGTPSAGQPHAGRNAEESRGEEKNKPLAPAKPTRERDLIFEAITEACGLDIDELTSSARGAANKAAKELREVGASPDGIHARAKVYRQKWADRELTPSALARHYAQLGAKAKGPPKAGSPVFGSDDWEARQAEQAELERRLLGDSA